jgi:hypothetical protein
LHKQQRFGKFQLLPQRTAVQAESAWDWSDKLIRLSRFREKRFPDPANRRVAIGCKSLPDTLKESCAKGWVSSPNTTNGKFASIAVSFLAESAGH